MIFRSYVIFVFFKCKMIDIQRYFALKNEIYNNFISFVECENDIDIYYQILIDFLEIHAIQENREDMKLFLRLISKVAKNTFRKSNLFEKIEKIILHFENEIKQTFSNWEIFTIFKKQKRILLFLFEKRIINVDNAIAQYFLQKNDFYFYHEIKFFIENKKKEIIESKLAKFEPDILNNYEEKRRVGENDSYICFLIRNDLIDEFITFVNQTNLTLSNSIKPSIFETNSFLLKKKEITLIEYAAFFGSIQIFQYLRLNNIELTSSLWLYSIHGRNGEIIHLLEESHVVPERKSYEKCLEESIKCHHNDIANYIQNNYINSNEEKFNENVLSYSLHYHNYEYFTNDMNNKFIFYYACQYDYLELVKLYINRDELNINLNEKIIFKKKNCFFNNVYLVVVNL